MIRDVGPAMKTVVRLPQFDTGQYNGATLTHNGDAILAIDIIELGCLRLHFVRCRYIQFTALYNCSSDMVKSYFCVDDLGESADLSRYVLGDIASKKAYKSLSHYRIFLDETGCYDIYSESVALV